MKAIVVLSDNETWGMLDHSTIRVISEEDFEALADGDVRPDELEGFVMAIDLDVNHTRGVDEDVC